MNHLIARLSGDIFSRNCRHRFSFAGCQPKNTWRNPWTWPEIGSPLGRGAGSTRGSVQVKTRLCARGGSWKKSDQESPEWPLWKSQFLSVRPPVKQIPPTQTKMNYYSRTDLESPVFLVNESDIKKSRVDSYCHTEYLMRDHKYPGRVLIYWLTRMNMAIIWNRYCKRKKT